MSFRVAGKLIERYVRLGDTVRRDQILARLDAADAEQQTSSAQAALDAAKHRLAFAQQQLDRDTAQSAQISSPPRNSNRPRTPTRQRWTTRDQATAQLAVAQNNVRYNTLRADHDGAITTKTRIPVKLSPLVRPSTAWPGAATRT